jgi:hypothetical protein
MGALLIEVPIVTLITDRMLESRERARRLENLNMVLEWFRYREYLRDHYPYLFSLAMRKNPFDETASVIVMQDS